MASRDEVEVFLSGFMAKLGVFDITYFDERGKNTNALIELGITPAHRKEVIKKLKVEDYSEGPIPDILYNLGELWVFGKDVNGIEVYIKVSMGRPNSKTICISFHKAERKMKYPFKENE